jgi:serine/threonine protein kinase
MDENKTVIVNLQQEDTESLTSQYSVVPSHLPSLLNRRYVMGECIGVGGLSEVYEVSDRYSEYFRDRRKLAVKIPSGQMLQKRDIVPFVYGEFSHLCRLSHPNIVKVFDFGIDVKSGKIPYIVLERLRGRMLKEFEPGEIEDEMRADVAWALLSAVEYFHLHGIVHADISTANIMYINDGGVKLFDFGISINRFKEQRFTLDYRNNKAFNPLYAAPEIHEGTLPNVKTDLFSLAAMLFELYRGHLPYEKRSSELADHPVGFKQMKGVPFGLRRWLKRALDADAAKRPDRMPGWFRRRHIGIYGNMH